MLKTRLDGRSKENRSFVLKNELGTVLAEFSLNSNNSTTLEISTADGLYIEKPSGWNSQN